MNFYGQVRKPAGVQGIMIARRMNQNHRGMMRWALEHMDLSPIRNMLDLGCGGGGPLSMLSDRTPEAHFVGLDPSRDMLRMTCKVNGRLVCGSFEDGTGIRLSAAVLRPGVRYRTGV